MIRLQPTMPEPGGLPATQFRGRGLPIPCASERAGLRDGGAGPALGANMNKPPSDLIKKIPVDRLRKGMFVHDLDCSWLDHPFATSAFLVTTEQRIQVIRGLGIHDVYIDPTEGA